MLIVLDSEYIMEADYRKANPSVINESMWNSKLLNACPCESD